MGAREGRDARRAELDDVLFDLADGAARASRSRSSSYLPETAPRILAALGQPHGAGLGAVSRTGGASRATASSRPRRSSRASTRRRRGVIDTHAHLDACADPPGEVARARTGSGRRSDHRPSATTVEALPDRARARGGDDGVFASLGIHPHEARLGRRGAVDELRELLGAPESRRAWGRPGSTTSATTRRTTRSATLFERAARARGRAPASRSSSTRARPTTTRSSVLGRFDGDGRPALLLVAGAARRRRSSAAGTSRSPATSTYPKADRPARSPRRRSRPSGSSPRPTSPYLAPQPRARPAERAGVRRAHARDARRGARRRPGRARRAQIDANATAAFGLP